LLMLLHSQGSPDAFAQSWHVAPGALGRPR
jgi:hypothetical protein